MTVAGKKLSLSPRPTTLVLAGTLSLVFGASPLLSMTIGLSVYTDATMSRGVITAYGSTTDISSDLGPCVHSGYDTGLEILNADNGSVIGNEFGETINVNEAINDIFGEYSLIGTAGATCSCAGQFGGGGGSTLNVQPPVINQGGIVIYPSAGGAVSSIEPGTTGVLVIYGTGLAAGGYDLNPVVAVTNGVVITGLASVADDQLNVNYSATSATSGTASVTVTTYVATSSPASVPVGDLTPVITGISQTTFVVGQPTSATITGNNFGTNLPGVALSIPSSTVTVNSGNTDTTVNITVTAGAVGTGTFTITSAGFNGQGFEGSPGQVKSGVSPQVNSMAPQTFTVSYQSWIPFDHVVGFSSCFYAPYTVPYLYNGNPTTGTFAGG